MCECAVERCTSLGGGIGGIRRDDVGKGGMLDGSKRVTARDEGNHLVLFKSLASKV
jgi:hypothetical protein